METENNRRSTVRRRRPGKTRQIQQQDIQYTQPKPFFRKRLTVQLLTVAAVALAIAVGTSIFFKVDTVTVSGASKYSAQTVAEVSKIQAGDSLLFFGRGKAASRIKSALPYVGTVRFEVKLPGTVNIVIEEKRVAYALKATDGSWWKMTSDGMIVEKVENTDSIGPTVSGVVLKDPSVGKKAVADEENHTQETVTATAAERLQAAVCILYQLEAYELFSDVTDVNVTDLFALRLYCGSDYRVELGSAEDLPDKVGAVKTAMVGLTNSGAMVLKPFYEDEIWQVQCNPWTKE